MGEAMSHQHHLIVIGSGSGGKDAAILAARTGLSVLLVEKESLGGTCFHRGCHAIRALRACAMHYGEAERSSRFGLSVDLSETGWTDWIGTQRRVSARLTERLSQTLEALGVQIRYGSAKLLNPNEIEISDSYGARDRVSAESIIIATGSRPAFPSVKDSRILNSDQMLKNVQIPEHLLIIGGGYIGCEFAAIYRTLGVRVTLIEEKQSLLPTWDPVAGDQIRDSLLRQGATVYLNAKVDLPAQETWTTRPVFDLRYGAITSPDLTLIATGRKPNVEELDLESIGVATDNFIPVNEKMATAQPNVFAIGDVNGLALLDSVAFAQARVAVETILGKAARFDLRWVPRCVHTDPPVASVGWTEKEAIDAGHEIEVLEETLQLVTDDDRSIVDPEPLQIRLVVKAETRTLLGCQAVGEKAAEIVNLAGIALSTGLSVTQLVNLVMVHPSASEALVRCLQSRFDRPTRSMVGI
jgi:pyruvate/2-oxoglutarate dehydrogenase complex dihydrolipoamide dehydrogenase (E3) component